MNNMGVACAGLGKLEDAAQWHERARTRFTELGYRAAALLADYNLAELAWNPLGVEFNTDLRAMLAGGDRVRMFSKSADCSVSPANEYAKSRKGHSNDSRHCSPSSVTRAPRSRIAI